MRINNGYHHNPRFTSVLLGEDGKGILQSMMQTDEDAQHMINFLKKQKENIAADIFVSSQGITVHSKADDSQYTPSGKFISEARKLENLGYGSPKKLLDNLVELELEGVSCGHRINPEEYKGFTYSDDDYAKRRLNTVYLDRDGGDLDYKPYWDSFTAISSTADYEEGELYHLSIRERELERKALAKLNEDNATYWKLHDAEIIADALNRKAMKTIAENDNLKASAIDTFI